MKSRCYNPKDTNYKHYGGRGIIVCDEWRKSFAVFYEWVCTSGYEEGRTLDRINNDGNYEPTNCRWATPKEQANNTRINRHLERDGTAKTVSQWAEDLGINRTTIIGRKSAGMSDEESLQEVVKMGKVMNTGTLKTCI